MRYRTHHITTYRYQAPVTQCISEARLTPRTFPGQRLEESVIRAQPVPVSIERRLDYFGNPVTLFSILERHDRLVVESSSTVEITPSPAPVSSMAWEDARERLAQNRDEAALFASEFVYDSPYVAASRELQDFGAPAFTAGAPLAEVASALSAWIHKQFRYVPKSTAIDMPLEQVLRGRRGVCQDFAHVMIGVLRSHGLAARYVSGYLRSGAEYTGAEASHAWVAVYLPDAREWLSLDPTNNVIPSDGHVTLAWGRDYGDVTPVKGVSLGGGKQIVDVAVKVLPVQA
jgi:transglutaminase-like putative cysteine protease